MGSNDGKGNLEEDGNFRGGRFLLAQLLVHSIRNSSQMIIHYGGTLRVFNSITPEKAQVVISAATAKKKGTRAPSSESFIARELVNQATTQGDLLSELPVARRNSLHSFLEKRRQRLLVKKAPYAVKNTKESFLDGSSDK